MTNIRVQVEGLQELLRNVRKIDRAWAKEMTHTLREDVGRPLSEDMKRMAEDRGLHLTGKLISGIRPSVRGATLFIQDATNKHGYNYPRRYEYENSGERAFMGPVLDRWGVSGEVERKFDGFLNFIDRTWHE